MKANLSKNGVASATVKTSAKHYAERRDGHKSPRIALLAAMMVAIMMGITVNAFAIDIRNQGEWDAFVIDGKTYNGETVNLLTSSITATKAKPQFNGTFDGKGYTITVNIMNSGNGLFSSIGALVANGSATIKNLTIKGNGVIVTTANSTTTLDNVGGIAGKSNLSKIENCTNLCANIASINGNNVGGIVGYKVDYFLKNCGNAANVTGKSKVGGIVGNDTYFTYEGISLCINTGKIKGSANYTGGIAGYIEGSSVQKCINAGYIDGVSYVGGVVGGGANSVSEIMYCVSTGVVNGTTYPGGIVGYIQYGVGPSSNNTIIYNYYDNQMCTYRANGVNNQDYADYAEGKSTVDMIGGGLSQLGGIFTTNTGLYPTITTINSNIRYVAATPLFLSNNNKSNGVSYKYRCPRQNGVNWSSVSTNVWQDANNADWWISPLGETATTMSAILNGVRKDIPLKLSTSFMKMNLLSNAGTFSISEVFPSIVTNEANLKITTLEAGYASIAIYDVTGAKVMSMTDEYVNANSETVLNMNNLSQLATGMYTIVITSGNDIAIRKFMKQ